MTFDPPELKKRSNNKESCADDVHEQPYRIEHILSEISRKKPRVHADLQSDPLEQQLLEDPRVAWGFASDAPLTVIGQLRGRLLTDDPSVFFLDGLEHPESGVGLAYPQSTGPGLANAFVPQPEISRLADPDAALSRTQWAIAELQLSPLRERERHQNPYECSVRRGTLRLLSEIPKQWNITITGR